MNNYKYDIAISLCKEDVDFARKLVEQINPKLNIFFYEDRQEEVVGKLGPKKFAKVFGKEARVVVILYRKEWGESYNTGLEEDAIHQRTKEGYDFIIIISLDENDKAPDWYVSNRIYADARKLSVEELTNIIEMRVSERGGEVEPLTFEERVELFQEKLEKRREINNYLISDESQEDAQEEVEKLRKYFNQKLEFIEEQDPPFKRVMKDIENLQIGNTEGELYMDDVRLDVNIVRKSRGKGSQIYQVEFHHRLRNKNVWGKPKSHVYRYNTDLGYKQGWSEFKTYRRDELGNIPYHDCLIWDQRGYFYELGKIIPTEQLIEQWFQYLFEEVEDSYKPVLSNIRL